MGEAPEAAAGALEYGFPSRFWARVGLVISAVALLGFTGVTPSARISRPPLRDMGTAAAGPSALTGTGPSPNGEGEQVGLDPCEGPVSPGRSVPGLAVVSGVGRLGLRVRSGPGVQFPTHLVLREGVGVTLSGETHVDEHDVEWYRLRENQSDEKGGWASAQYFTRVDLCEPDLPEDHGPSVVANVLVARITAYTYQEPVGGAHGSITKSGLPVAWGMVAVDPTVIPLGTSLLIEGFSQRFVARDTGFGVLGAHVDIFFPDLESAIEFGVQRREIVILAESCLAERDPSTCRGSG